MVMTIIKLMQDLEDRYQDYLYYQKTKNKRNLSFLEIVIKELITELIRQADESIEKDDLKSAISIFTNLLKNYTLFIREGNEAQYYYFILFQLIFKYYGVKLEESINYMISASNHSLNESLIKVLEKYCQEFEGFKEIWEIMLGFYDRMDQLDKCIDCCTKLYFSNKNNIFKKIAEKI